MAAPVAPADSAPPRASARATIPERTLRTDRWWLSPAISFVILTAFVAYATYAALPSGSLLRPGWDKSISVHQFFQGNAVAKKPIGGPLFVIAGEADQTVPIEGVRDAVKEMCAAKQPVEFRSYPGLDHDPTMETSTPEQLKWIRSRFAGKAVTSNCAAGGS